MEPSRFFVRKNVNRNIFTEQTVKHFFTPLYILSNNTKEVKAKIQSQREWDGMGEGGVQKDGKKEKKKEGHKDN